MTHILFYWCTVCECPSCSIAVHRAVTATRTGHSFLRRIRPRCCCSYQHACAQAHGVLDVPWSPPGGTAAGWWLLFSGPSTNSSRAPGLAQT